jgi:hypothetical protein
MALLVGDGQKYFQLPVVCFGRHRQKGYFASSPAGEASGIHHSIHDPVYL